MTNQDCIFCKIVSREIPAPLLAENDLAVAFNDISPRQPVHILVVPKRHHIDVAELTEQDPEALLAVMRLGVQLAAEYADGSFRFSFNTGAAAGQSVFHAHGHVTSTQPKKSVVAS